MQHPYIILTMRRTGGTSLMSFMSAISSFPTRQHEPLNVDRVWGQITRDFTATQDQAAARAALAEQLADRPNIKHCFEIIPAHLNRILIEECAARGYRFFVLTRRNEASRLRSLFLALATQAWGPEQAARIYPEIRAGRQKAQAVSVEQGRKAVHQAAISLGQVLTVLRNRRIDHDWLVFEEIYKGETSIQDHAIRIAAQLGVQVGPDDGRLQAFASGEGQNSGAIEGFVPGMPDLMNMLEDLVLA
ncbi:hypothetical protein ACSSNL_18250 [Thalassobius sp. S69A]|uniref:hypothetical protein n=1 Tax=unclassified Thalassovita TaxID=2619711 RepID=UPI000C0CD854|nr:hypothetical protein [Paracoccaceae bacterium]MBA86352.1 hypothetical protein [Paracoccaceae bacterium]MBT26899.1 hypothetical protein [Paracoccaceae bacterium]